MARTDDDRWNLASSVGATATMVAAGRALATRDPRGLIDDPFAAPLVEAVGLEFFTKLVTGELDLTGLDAQSRAWLQRLLDGTALRTKYYDQYFLGAAARGVRQAAILASGLDTRAYRLRWPPGMVVYEIDQPQVLDFKTTTLAAIGAQPTAARRTVAVDLREDWPRALRAAGLDVAARTVWSAEGLLQYLPPDAADRLFDAITGLSAAGARIATEYPPGLTDFDASKARAISAGWHARGFNLDMASLMFTGERSDVVEYLNGLGWRTQSLAVDDLFARNGVARAPVDDAHPFDDVVYVSATFTGSQPTHR